jgi:GTP-binding protein
MCRTVECATPLPSLHYMPAAGYNERIVRRRTWSSGRRRTERAAFPFSGSFLVAVPVVAIVGRPNVGKSSLFNWLAGRRIAIVDPTAGVTRDRLTTLVAHRQHFFELVDTGGIGIRDVDDLTADVERQIQHALEQAAVVLFVVDGRDGVVPLDQLVAERLRSLTCPVVCVVNKCDAAEMESLAADFHRLGYEPVLVTSTLQNRGRGPLLEAIVHRLPEASPQHPPADVALKLAIVGRRNTGKSTFINTLARHDRVIVSEVPGTTRDSVDVRFERDGKTFLAIDTAGVRRKRSLQNNLEFYSLARAERSIRRADVVLLFFDAPKKISKVDKQLCEYILEQHKPAVFVVNKWDLLSQSLTTGEFADYLRKNFPSLDHVPIAFISAKQGRNVHAVLNLAQNLHDQAGVRVETGELNRVIQTALTRQGPPLRRNRRAKVFYCTQVAVHPPTIVMMTNGPELLDNTYRRYLLKTLRDQFPFAEVPIKLYFRKKRQTDAVEEPNPGSANPLNHTKRMEKRVRKALSLTPPAVARRTAAPGKAKRASSKGKPAIPELWSDL